MGYSDTRVASHPVMMEDVAANYGKAVAELRAAHEEMRSTCSVAMADWLQSKSGDGYAQVDGKLAVAITELAAQGERLRDITIKVNASLVDNEAAQTANILNG
ncbi:MAG: hypothetical protein ACRCYR_11490 [Phycicoccus sp.]